jgi:hypothetical protein
MSAFLEPPTEAAKNGQAGTGRTYTLGMTGVFSANPTKPIKVFCYHTPSTSNSSVVVSHAALTLTRVSTVHSNAPAARPRHRFTKPAPPAAGVYQRPRAGTLSRYAY